MKIIYKLYWLGDEPVIFSNYPIGTPVGNVTKPKPRKKWGCLK